MGWTIAGAAGALIVTADVGRDDARPTGSRRP